MGQDIKDQLKESRERLKSLEKHLDVSGKRKKIGELQSLSQADSFWQDPRNAQGVMRELDSLRAIVDKFEIQQKIVSDIEGLYDLLVDEGSEDLLKEAEAQLALVEKGIEEMEFARMLAGENDGADAILQINAGAGGTESCDWAEMLLRMYRRWADRKGFKSELVDFTEGDGAGFRSATLIVQGNYAYGYLKAENGVHRLVRISPFDANKRRHTSFASVFALPDVEKDINIEVNEEDLRVDTFRSGGAGGQHVNKTESAVRLTHLPSGIVVACQSERSQHQNRATAMKLLKAKLYEAELTRRQKEKKEIEKGKKKIEWGSQIRSYVLQPYRLVKDHRTDLEIGNVDAVMDGDIDPFIQKFLMEKS